jgi:hypothetical protein
MLTPKDRKQLWTRWTEVHSELDDIGALKVVKGPMGPAEREAELSKELSEIESRLGLGGSCTSHE